jgi:murein DD-endopeptidase MepM/ murein hydrolase activator NlpD
MKKYVPLLLWLGMVTGGIAYFLAAPPRATESGKPATSATPAALSTPASPQQGQVKAAAPPTTIGLPIFGLRAADIQDTFGDTRDGLRQHEAVDILAPRDTPVHAVVDGVVKKLFLSKPGGLTVYQFDDKEEFSYYYAHLNRYADGLEEGQRLKRGDILGFVGSTGNADPKTPHLHFAIFELKPDKRWWEGTPINPYPMLIDALKAELHIR